ncbi:TetR/AcrR family transcriptional regulator [Amycolatopsis thermophila]|uniref:AcrR family transcriptional regulator n=1 Tax=Amycolatopsis thermophila TaxID=206084 RepID=A0ABU0F6T1_9PSEU|nr:TetR/AcrR family transcriptional regulator [Amycolatopsis thermophila]MDQ0382750.1 AcrR family transcriptional regulator [Amycolatopsis thermophila]
MISHWTGYAGVMKTRSTAADLFGDADAGGGDGTPVKRRSLREEQKEMTRRKLIEASKDVFERKGYAKATIDDIVETAGASRGTFYLYFKSKGEVAAELTAQYTREVEELLADVGERLDPDRAAIKRWVEAYLKLFVRHEASVRAWMQAESSERELRAVSDERLATFVSHLTAWINETRRRNGLGEPVEASRSRAIVLLTQLERFSYFSVLRGMRVDKRSAVESLVDFWELTLRGEVTGSASTKR